MHATMSDVRRVYDRLVGRTLYLVRRKSTWCGIGAVDEIDDSFAIRDEAQQYVAQSETHEGQYGDVYASIDKLRPSPAIVTLWGTGAEYDPDWGRVWVGANCVASSSPADVHEYGLRQSARCRLLTSAEADYLAACWVAIVNRHVRDVSDDGSITSYRDH